MVTIAQPTGLAPKGLSIHIGLNAVDAKHYEGWDGPLAGAEADAQAMAALATAQGMATELLAGPNATRSKLLAALRRALKSLAAGDLLFISYSGYGGRMPNVASGDVADRQSLTWCLRDGQWLEPELWALLRRMPVGARALVVCDSSHSATVTRAGPPALSAATGVPRIKLMPTAVALRTYTGHRAFYDKLHKDLALAAAVGVDPPTVMLQGAQDNQTALDDGPLGPFTARLLAVWQGGNFKGDYGKFHARLRAAMPPSQSPNLFTRGDAAAFVKQRPFTV